MSSPFLRMEMHIAENGKHGRPLFKLRYDLLYCRLVGKLMMSSSEWEYTPFPWEYTPLPSKMAFLAKPHPIVPPPFGNSAWLVARIGWRADFFSQVTCMLGKILLVPSFPF